MAQANGSIFNKAFNNSNIESIDFNPGWNNGTGYFDNLTFKENKAAPALNPGELKKFIDGNGRRAIIIGTRLGNVVVFDRFVNQVDTGVWVTNAPNKAIFKTLLSGSSVGEAEMITLLGGWGIIEDNLGNAIELMAQDLAA